MRLFLDLCFLGCMRANLGAPVFRMRTRECDSPCPTLLFTSHCKQFATIFSLGLSPLPKKSFEGSHSFDLLVYWGSAQGWSMDQIWHITCSCKQSVVGTQSPHLFTHIDGQLIFSLLWQSWVDLRRLPQQRFLETKWLMKPQIFTAWSFAEQACRLLNLALI